MVRSRNIEETTEDRIVLIDEVLTIRSGVFALVIIAVMSSFFLHPGISMLMQSVGDPVVLRELTVPLLGLFLILIFGYFIFCMLHDILIRESVVIDRRLQSVIIEGNSPVKYITFIKKIPFTDLKAVEIMRNTSCEHCDYASPVTDSSDSWDVSLITIDGGSVYVYYSDSKSESERISEKIGAISDKVITHQLKYTPPDYGGGG